MARRPKRPRRSFLFAWAAVAAGDAGQCIGPSNRPYPRQVFGQKILDGKSGECEKMEKNAKRDATLKGETCMEFCKDPVVRNAYQDRFTYTCNEHQKTGGTLYCKCFTGPTPKCDRGVKCKLPMINGEYFDVSNCTDAPYPQQRSCKVKCKSAPPGERPKESVLTCPDHNQNKDQLWWGALPDCLSCDSEIRPSHAWPGFQDNCENTKIGDSCDVQCSARSTHRAKSHCLRVDPVTGVCDCFKTDDEKPLCHSLNLCKRPRGALAIDPPNGNYEPYDISNCEDPNQAESCVVQCAAGFAADPLYREMQFSCSDETGTRPVMRWPYCKKISCGDPPEIGNAEALSVGPIFAGEHAKYKCEKHHAPQVVEGIRIERDVFFIKCTDAGIFSLPSNVRACQAIGLQGCIMATRPEKLLEGVRDTCVGLKKRMAKCEAYCDYGWETAYGGCGSPDKACKITCRRYEHGFCTCYGGTMPQCRHSGAAASNATTTTTTTLLPTYAAKTGDCTVIPDLPNAVTLTPGLVTNRGLAEYNCNQGYSANGRDSGDDLIKLACIDGYLKDFDKVGCKFIHNDYCPLNSTLESESLESSCKNKQFGQSCTVSCKPGYYESLPDRYSKPMNPDERTPVILECHPDAFFYTKVANIRMPYCVKSEVKEFDVYGIFMSDQKDYGPDINSRLNYPDAEIPFGPFYKIPEDDVGNSLPSNVNLFDLEGLLQHIYVDLFKPTDTYYKNANVYVDRYSPSRNMEMRDWRDRHLRKGAKVHNMLLRRDIVDTVVWYKLKVRNPPTLSGGSLVNFEFAPFGDFQHGKAQNTAVDQVYREHGEVVGLKHSKPGVLVTWKTKQLEGKPPNYLGELIRAGGQSHELATEILAHNAKCGNPMNQEWDGEAGQTLKAQECYKEETWKIGAPFYMPAGPFVTLSVPGYCPNVETHEKVQVNNGRPDPRCIRAANTSKDNMEHLPDGADFLEELSSTPYGGCAVGGPEYQKGTPSGARDCTYVLTEVARISLDELLGVTEQMCKGTEDGFQRACRNLTDFQYNCADESLRHGTQWCEKANDVPNDPRCRDYGRQCTEYAMAPQEVRAGDTVSGQLNQSFYCQDKGENKSAGSNMKGGMYEWWKCDEGCNEHEVAIPFLKGRCDANRNEERLKVMKAKLEKTAEKQSGGLQQSLSIAQDCDQKKDCQNPTTHVGTSYCQRDDSGVCEFCVIPDVTDWDPRRLETQGMCRTDLFSSGAYKEKGSPDCSQDETPGETSCCRYTGNCNRKWERFEKVDHGAFDTKCNECGPDKVLSKAVCQHEDILGDCRKDQGDPKGGYCEHGKCYFVERCEGKQCGFLPFCSELDASQGDVDTIELNCIPDEWGPVKSACGYGIQERYRRCKWFSPDTPKKGMEYCEETLSSMNESLWMRRVLNAGASKISRCGECDVDGRVCKRCVGDEDHFRLMDVPSKDDPDKKVKECVPKKPLLEFRINVDLPQDADNSFETLSWQELEGLLRLSTKDIEWHFGKVFLIDAHHNEAPAKGNLQTMRRLADGEVTWNLDVGLVRDVETAPKKQDGDGNDEWPDVQEWLEQGVADMRNKLASQLQRRLQLHLTPSVASDPETPVVTSCPQHSDDEKHGMIGIERLSDPSARCSKDIPKPPYHLYAAGFAVVLVLVGLAYSKISESQKAASQQKAQNTKNGGIEMQAKV